MIKAGLIILSICICVCVFLLGIQEHTNKQHKSRFVLFLQNSNIRLFDHEKTMQMLIKYGIIDTFPFLNPFGWQIIRAFAGILISFFANYFLKSINFAYPGLAFLLIPIGFPAIEGLAKWMNKKDNEDMMIDIRKIYDTLKIQSKAGMFLSESLMEIYRIVSHKRLKKALLEMNAQLFMVNDINSAIETFNSKFDNEYIDTLCITLKQAEQSGQTIKILEDVSSQLVSVQKQISKKEESSLARKLLGVQLLVFATIIIITVIMLIDTLSSTLQF